MDFSSCPRGRQQILGLTVDAGKLDWIDIGDPMRVQDMFNELKPKHDAIEPGRPVEGCDDDPDDPDWPEDPGEIKRRGDL